MEESKRKQVADAFAALPDGCKSAVATEDQLEKFESSFGPIPDEFRWFLIHCGGGTIVSEWVDGIDELRETHCKFKAESALENGWTMDGVFQLDGTVPAIPLVLRGRPVECSSKTTTLAVSMRCLRRSRIFSNVDFY